MKKYILFFAMLFCTSGLFSQEDFSINESSTALKDLTEADKIELPELIWKLDSSYYYTGDGTAWDLDYKYKTLSRDEFGNRLIIGSYIWNMENEEWVNRTLISQTFHTPEIRNTYLKRAWNTETETWSDTIKYLKNDETGNKLEYSYRYWNYTNNEFGEGGAKSLYTYDENGNMSQYFGLIYDNEISGWINHKFSVITYDENDYRIQALTTVWHEETNSWLNSEFKQYTHDENGNRTSELIQNWDASLGEWIDHKLFSYTFDANNNRLVFIVEGRNGSAGEWVYLSKETATYNEMELKDYRSFEFIENGEWNLEYQTFYTYDTNGNRTVELHQSWLFGDWVSTDKYLYYYDSNGNKIETLESTDIYPFGLVPYKQTLQAYDENENLIQITSTEFDEALNSWVNLFKRDYYFTEVNILETDTPVYSNIVLFPNPTNGIVNITNSSFPEHTSVKIYSSVGMLIKTIQLDEQGTIDISNLPNGSYFINIHTSEGFITKKVEKI